MEDQDKGKKEVLTALKKARSSLDGVITMYEDGKYCVDIMQQNLAVLGLLRSAHEKLMDHHLHTCFTNGMNSANKQRKQDMIEEINKLMRMGGK
jgi:DNA-binding FrmR family transcriptional regulator